MGLLSINDEFTTRAVNFFLKVRNLTEHPDPSLQYGPVVQGCGLCSCCLMALPRDPAVAPVAVRPSCGTPVSPGFGLSAVRVAAAARLMQGPR